MFSARNFVVLVAIACLALIVFLLFGLRGPATVAKVIASSAFVALVLQSEAAAYGYGRLILLGLVYSWFGDVFLTIPTQTAFLFGLGAFLLAHAAYIAAFIVHGVNIRWLLLAALPIVAVASGVTAWLAPHVAPDVAIPVLVYTVVIGIMVLMAFGTRGKGGHILILAGALLFFVSDLSVAAMRLVQIEWPTYILGLPLYYGGQVCLALSVSHSRSH